VNSGWLEFSINSHKKQALGHTSEILAKLRPNQGEECVLEGEGGILQKEREDLEEKRGRNKLSSDF